SFLVTFDELAGEPAKHIISDAGCVSNVGILREATRFKSLVSEFFHEALQRHAILQSNRSESADRIHQPANRASFLRHRDEEPTRLTIFVYANRDVTFMSCDHEQMR